MQIMFIQDLHPGSYQKKTGFLGCMQFDRDIAVLSIQVIISLHRRLGISIEPASSQSLLIPALLFLRVHVVLTESF